MLLLFVRGSGEGVGREEGLGDGSQAKGWYGAGWCGVARCGAVWCCGVSGVRQLLPLSWQHRSCCVCEQGASPAQQHKREQGGAGRV